MTDIKHRHSTGPWLMSPFTDLTGALLTHQWRGRATCGDLEMKALDCLEAYGLQRGLIKCDAIIKDFKECCLKTKRIKRILAMRAERERQYSAGERTKANHYAHAPPYDSY